MFEKEAGFAETKMLINCNGDYSKKQDYKKGWQDGAEFGYNKANEWQYVSERGTPQKEGHYLVCLLNKDKDIFDCWIYYDKDVGWYSMKVRMKDIYAWKEIVPPSLDKEKADDTDVVGVLS